jgi:hypothetical protein
MDVQVATLCDSASDYGGKLCVLGTFDTICASSLPVAHPQCALALRICFKPGDEGEHVLGIRLIDDDGNTRFVIPPPEVAPPKINVVLPPEAYFLTRNLIINIQRLPFEKVGQFSIDITVDDEMLTRIPLRVMLLEKKGE